MDSDAMAEGDTTAAGRVFISGGAWWIYSFACSSHASFKVPSKGMDSFGEIFW